ncbi:MAG: glucose 1-dehydrogenase [bacterium]
MNKLKDTQRLSGKVCLVTGGGNGIGEATAIRLAEEGAVVAVSDIQFEAASAVAQRICDGGGTATAYHQDVTDKNQWLEIIEQIISESGQLDVLINNAGVSRIANIEEETLDDWRKVQSVNTESVFLGCQAAIAAMKEKGGAIINISSIMGLVGDQDETAYNASKGGVRLMTKSIALHCANKGYNIRVNSVHPGYIETPMMAAAVETMGAKAEEMIGRIMGNIPVKKLGNPVDIANGCLFLASDQSAYMTGSELVIDGGYTAH